MSGPDLESRYRRLLAWYPWSHRRVYEDEMLAVLVTGARPGQRRPTVGETANLVVSGLRARAQAAVTDFVNPAWVDAAAVVGLLAALVLLSQRVVRLLEGVVLYPGGPIELQMYLRAAGWAAVLLAMLIGLRRAAAVLAWVTVLGEAVLLTRQYESDPVSTVRLLWPLVLAMTAAAALTVPAPRRRAVSVLRAPRLLAFVVGLGLVHAVVLANAHQLATPLNGTGGTSYAFYGLMNESASLLHLWLAAVAVGALSATFAALTLPTPVRLRIAVLLAPIVTLAATVKLTLDGWAYSNSHMGHPIYLVPVQWALLVALPLTALPIGALLVQRKEHKARLIALGRSADREGPNTA
jgi:hypothetical protein